MRFDPTTSVPPEHHQRLGQQMRDETELDGLKDNIMRNLKGEAIVTPWRTGRPLRSTGLSNPNTGLPITPLAALDLKAVVPPSVADQLSRELDRCVTLDMATAGHLDRADAMGLPIVEEELWSDAIAAQEADIALQQLLLTRQSQESEQNSNTESVREGE